MSDDLKNLEKQGRRLVDSYADKPLIFYHRHVRSFPAYNTTFSLLTLKKNSSPSSLGRRKKPTAEKLILAIFLHNFR